MPGLRVNDQLHYMMWIYEVTGMAGSHVCVWRISSPEEQSGAALSDSHLLCVLKGATAGTSLPGVLK